MRVVTTRTSGIVRRVRLLDDAGAEVAPVARFLDHPTRAGYSPTTRGVGGRHARGRCGRTVPRGVAERRPVPA
jgi:hypothetical protein